MLLEADDAHILRQFRILLLRFGLEELQLFLNFVHVSLEREPKVILMLAQHIDKLLIVGLQRVCDLLEGVLHLVDVGLEICDDWVRTRTSILKLRLQVSDERFKNYRISTKSGQIR